MNAFSSLKSELLTFHERQIAPVFHTAELKPEGLVSLRGRNLLHCCSWDFLNLNLEPHFKRVAQRQIEESGIGVASSRGSAGTSRQLLCCESKLAQFLGCESALLFSSTNQAIFTLLTSLLSDRDVVVYEELLQSPVGDAAYLVGADVGTFCGSKLDELGSFLENKRAARRCYIVAEAVSPLTGRCCDLRGLAAIARRYGAFLIVDESAALAAQGLRGGGGCEKFQADISDVLLCEWGDLSMGMASYGAVLGGPKFLIDYVVGVSKTIPREVPLPHPLVVAIEAAVELVELKPTIRERLALKAERLTRGLAAIVPSLGVESDSHVVCATLSHTAMALQLAEALFERGFLVEVPSHKRPLSDVSWVRLVVNEAFTDRQIDSLLEAVSDVAPRILRG